MEEIMAFAPRLFVDHTGLTDRPVKPELTIHSKLSLQPIGGS
jgi:hypothetical protein